MDISAVAAGVLGNIAAEHLGHPIGIVTGGHIPGIVAIPRFGFNKRVYPPHFASPDNRDQTSKILGPYITTSIRFQTVHDGALSEGY